jgi:hypothetical protein
MDILVPLVPVERSSIFAVIEKHVALQIKSQLLGWLFVQV